MPVGRSNDDYFCTATPCTRILMKIQSVQQTIERSVPNPGSEFTQIESFILLKNLMVVNFFVFYGNVYGIFCSLLQNSSDLFIRLEAL
jgi:hypothetical protein